MGLITERGVLETGWGWGGGDREGQSSDPEA